MMQHRCKATTKSGEPCSARTLPESEWCFVHDPHRIIDIAEARKKGGQARSNRAKARRELEGAAMTAAELNGILAVTIRQVLSENKAPGIGQAIAALSRAALEASKASDLENRILDLERRLGSRSA